MRGVYDYDRGISAVDVLFERERLNAVHIVLERGRAAIVDTGTANGVGRVLEALAEKGVAPEQVDYVILTHVHLDHAGGAGQLMARCPNATLTVHPRGARHMIDPSRLLEATVGGLRRADDARACTARFCRCRPSRVRETPEGASVSLAGRELAFLDAPGHARHHVVVRDAASGGDLRRRLLRLVVPGVRPRRPAVFVPDHQPGAVRPAGPEAHHRPHPGLRAAGGLRHAFRPPARSAPAGRRLERLIDAHVAIAERHRGDGAERGARLRQASSVWSWPRAQGSVGSSPTRELRGVFESRHRAERAGTRSLARRDSAQHASLKVSISL